MRPCNIVSMAATAGLAGLAACTAPRLPQEAFSAGPRSSLSICPSTLAADGFSQAWIVLHVRDSAGAPVANVRASFGVESSSGQVWLVQPGPTDSRGKTTGIISSDALGTVSVVARLPVLPPASGDLLRASVRFVGPG